MKNETIANPYAEVVRNLMRRPQIFVGCKGARREVFKWHQTPTVESHGEKYGAIIGPFKTMRGALFMAECGGNNPHVQCVADAERIAKRIEAQEDAARVKAALETVLPCPADMDWFHGPEL